MDHHQSRELLHNLLTRIVGPAVVPALLDDRLPLHEQMRWDSMDYLDLAIEIRKQTGLQIQSAEMRQFTTPAALVQLLMKQDAGRTAPPDLEIA